MGKGAGTPERKAFTPFEFKLSETGDLTVAFSRFGVIDSPGVFDTVPQGQATVLDPEFAQKFWMLGEAKGVIGVFSQPTTKAKCARCWHRREDVGTHAAHPLLCGRCVSNVDGPGEVRSWF